MKHLSSCENINCFTCTTRSPGIFCHLSPEGLERLNKNKNTNIYKKNQNLFLQGNQPFGLFCLHSGVVKLSKTLEDGSETILRLAKKGDILGHRSLFSGSHYNATATVLIDAQICFISRSVIDDLLLSEKILAKNILHVLSQQMGQAEDRIVSLSQNSLKERLIQLLLFLEETHGSPTHDGRIKINLKLSREEWASLIGAATENLIRILGDLKKNGEIEEIGKQIYIKNKSRLLSQIEYSS